MDDGLVHVHPTKTAPEFEAIEPRTIATIAIYFKSKIHRPLLIHVAIYILLGA